MATKEFEVQQLLRAYRKGLISEELFASQMAELGETRNGQNATNGSTKRERVYDRTAEDLGNIVALEHVNVTVPDQQLATLFYVNGLGLIRDPYMMTGPANMWVNVGRSQFHLPTKAASAARPCRYRAAGLRSAAEAVDGFAQGAQRHPLRVLSERQIHRGACPWGPHPLLQAG